MENQILTHELECQALVSLADRLHKCCNVEMRLIHSTKELNHHELLILDQWGYGVGYLFMNIELTANAFKYCIYKAVILDSVALFNRIYNFIEKGE